MAYLGDAEGFERSDRRHPSKRPTNAGSSGSVTEFFSAIFATALDLHLARSPKDAVLLGWGAVTVVTAVFHGRVWGLSS